MVDGSLKPIGALTVGMMVQAWDEDTQEASVQEITKVHVIHNRPMVKMTVTYADGAFADDIFTTMNYPFHVDGKGWTAVEDMGPPMIWGRPAHLRRD